MLKRILPIASIVVAAAFGFLGYVIVQGPAAIVDTAEARGAIMLAVPNVVFNGPSAVPERGGLSETVLLSAG